MLGRTPMGCTGSLIAPVNQEPGGHALESKSVTHRAGFGESGLSRLVRIRTNCVRSFVSDGLMPLLRAPLRCLGRTDARAVHPCFRGHWRVVAHRQWTSDVPPSLHPPSLPNSSSPHPAAQAGWLITCANLGDSRAVLDTGASVMQLTVDHRVASNKEERRRVQAVPGAVIAPVCSSGGAFY